MYLVMLKEDGEPWEDEGYYKERSEAVERFHTLLNTMVEEREKGEARICEVKMEGEVVCKEAYTKTYRHLKS